MVKLTFSAFSILIPVALQVGCASMPGRADALRSSHEVLRPTCDTSIRYIPLTVRIPNDTSGDIEFHLDGDRGPPFDPWYLGYRVHSSAPGEPFRVVHNSGHDAVWTRTVAIGPGSSADFNVPIFGLRPADYHRYFRIEVRDSKGRSHWTPVFDLCSVSRCECPRVGALAASSETPAQACPATLARDRCE